MKAELRVKHKPADNPGSWHESTLMFKMVDDKEKVERVEKAIKEALNDKR